MYIIFAVLVLHLPPEVEGDRSNGPATADEAVRKDVQEDQCRHCGTWSRRMQVRYGPALFSLLMPSRMSPSFQRQVLTSCTGNLIAPSLTLTQVCYTRQMLPDLASFRHVVHSLISAHVLLDTRSEGPLGNILQITLEAHLTMISCPSIEVPSLSPSFCLRARSKDWLDTNGCMARTTRSRRLSHLSIDLRQ